jgi:hypothetical protein
MKNTISLLFTACALAACSSPAPSGSQAGNSGTVSQAATTPLSDLNLVRADIPAQLATAMKAPYAAPADASCAGLVAEVQALDAALGPDLDAPAHPNNPGLLERGGDAATGAFRSAAEGVIPFRGWVRKLSGAERYSREVAAAIAAGGVRRSFLKGLGTGGAAGPHTLRVSTS